MNQKARIIYRALLMSPSLSANTVSQMRKERKKKGDVIKKKYKTEMGEKFEKNHN